MGFFGFGLGSAPTVSLPLGSGSHCAEGSSVSSSELGLGYKPAQRCHWNHVLLLKLSICLKSSVRRFVSTTGNLVDMRPRPISLLHFVNSRKTLVLRPLSSLLLSKSWETLTLKSRRSALAGHTEMAGALGVLQECPTHHIGTSDLRGSS